MLILQFFFLYLKSTYKSHARFDHIFLFFPPRTDYRLYNDIPNKRTLQPWLRLERTIVGLTGHLKGMGSTKLHLFRFAIMSDFTPNLSNPFKIREYVNTSLDCTVDISLDNTYRQFCNLLIYQKKINGCSLAQARIVFLGHGPITLWLQNK